MPTFQCKLNQTYNCRHNIKFKSTYSVSNLIIFQYINDNVQLLEEHLIEFNQLAIKHSSGDEDILNRVMPKDNIALAAVFRTIVPNNGNLF